MIVRVPAGRLPVSRRLVLQVGVMAGAGFWLSSCSEPPDLGDGASEESSPPPGAGADVVEQIRALASRLTAGEGERLANGVIVIDGWYLSAAHVAKIRELAEAFSV